MKNFVFDIVGYVLEFRLSDETVNNFTDYKKVRDKYEKPENGGWLVLKDWLILNNFTCTWDDGNVPVKSGGTQLAGGIAKWIKDKSLYPQCGFIYASTLTGTCFNHSGSNVFHLEAASESWICAFNHATGVCCHDWSFTAPLLLVRPL